MKILFVFWAILGMVSDVFAYSIDTSEWSYANVNTITISYSVYEGISIENSKRQYENGKNIFSINNGKNIKYNADIAITTFTSEYLNTIGEFDTLSNFNGMDCSVDRGDFPDNGFDVYYFSLNLDADKWIDGVKYGESDYFSIYSLSNFGEFQIEFIYPTLSSILYLNGNPEVIDEYLNSSITFEHHLSVRARVDLLNIKSEYVPIPKSYLFVISGFIFFLYFAKLNCWRK